MYNIVFSLEIKWDRVLFGEQWILLFFKRWRLEISGAELKIQDGRPLS